MLRHLLAILALFAAACSEAPRPNVIVITIDTLRADKLPFYGFDKDTSPFLARLADKGVVFEHAWAPSSWTAPSTASLFTGLYPEQHRVEMGKIKFTPWAIIRYRSFGLTRIPPDIETLPVFMKSQGYRTFGIADNNNICEELGFKRGFDRFASTIYQAAPQVNATLSEWAEEIRGSDPYFLYLHYMDPHAPYEERAPWFDDSWATDQNERNLAKYESEIAYTDQHIQQAFEMLEVGDDTIIMLVADHGEEFGEHGGSGHKFKLYSELTRVPVMIYDPTVQRAQPVVTHNVSLVDILPTLRSMLGAPASSLDAGTSLREHYVGTAPPAPRPVFTTRRTIVEGAPRYKRGVIFENYKYIATTPGEERELYDLASDPGEQHNLIDDRPDVGERLDGYWQEFHAKARKWEPDTVEAEMDEEELEGLKRLGYVGGK